MPEVETTIKFSYQDYQNLPESETKRYELLEGELVMVPAPTWFHQSLSRVLFKLLDRFVDQHKLGEVRYAPLDVVLSEHDVVQPDLIYLSQEHLSLVREGAVQGVIAPALSQSTVIP